MNLFRRNSNKKNFLFTSPMSGNILPLSEIPDEAFAKGMMGDGFGIELTNGRIIAPFDAIITTVFPTGHAYGLKANDGTEVLLHIGIDTVELNGTGFTIHVQAGQHIKQNEPICDVDIDIIKTHKKSLISPIIFLNKQIYLLKSHYLVQAGDAEILQIK